MFGRPRCREWTPLATQQLRLRSLIQIVGYNIRPPECCTSPVSYYLTLHHTTMSAPFYTSERISSPHPKWKEIDSESTRRMSSTNIVIRIWCHTIIENSGTDSEASEQQDTIIQTWGVYFTGLRYIGVNLSNFTAECFKTNTLVFQMHGGYFSSYQSLKLDIIPPENDLEQLSSLSSDSSSKTKSYSLDNRLQFTHKVVKSSRSISPSKIVWKSDNCSKSHSPVERFRQSFPTLRTSTSLTIDRNKRLDTNVDKEHIYEHSPESLDKNCDSKESKLFNREIDVSETAENYDFRNEACGIPKYRYYSLGFLKSELRPSYNAAKLQKLHLLQYSIKKKQEAVDEIKEKIYKKSALDNLNDCNVKVKSKSKCNIFELSVDERVSGKTVEREEAVVTSNGSGSRFTLKLNDLLSFKAIPSPYQRAEHLRLTKQLEILRFKRIILSDERDSKLTNIRRLKQRYTKMFEENQDTGLELMQNYHSLSRNCDQLKKEREHCAALREIAANTHWLLANHRADLLMQLATLFYIDKIDESTWSIIDVPLPLSGDEGPKVSSVSEGVAAGLVAQCLAVFSHVTGLPLRYQMYFAGSHTKIVDIRPDLPDPNIPLYPVSGECSLFRYGLFLVNKCIVQYLFKRNQPVTDMRPTLSNLYRLMTHPSNAGCTSKLYGTYRPEPGMLSPRTQSLRSLVAAERGKHGRQFNRFKESVDGQLPHSSMSLQRHRLSKSVGSYQDDAELSALNASTSSIIGSEPNIYTDLTNQSNPHAITSLNLISHNSDSNIEPANVTEKVEFTLGDDTKLSDIDKNTSVIDKNMSDIDKNISDIDKNTSVIDKNTSVIDKYTSVIDKNTSVTDKNTSDIDKNTSVIDKNMSDIDKNRLVKMSTNNGDTASGSNVKDICEEINSYCANHVKDDNLELEQIDNCKITDSGIGFDENLCVSDRCVQNVDLSDHLGVLGDYSGVVSDYTGIGGDNSRVVNDSRVIGDHSGAIIDNTKIISGNWRIGDNSEVISDNSRVISDNFRVDSDNSRVDSDNSRVDSDNSRVVSNNIRVVSDKHNNTNVITKLSCHSDDVPIEIITNSCNDTNLSQNSNSDMNSVKDSMQISTLSHDTKEVKAILTHNEIDTLDIKQETDI